ISFLFFRFFLCNDLTKPRARKTVVAAIEVQLDPFFLAVSASRKILVGVLIPYDAYIQFKRPEDILQVLFGRVGHYLVHVLAATQLYIAFYHRLTRSIFIWAIQRWIHLQSTDQVITLPLRFGKHHDMSSM